MSRVLVLHRNFISADLLFGQSVSSELAAAPATNIYDKIRRTKTWRSGGYFVVTTSNRGIVLQESAGVNQTVNIATGTYTSDASFLAAVKTALDSASGSAVYTVSRNSTSKKIVISSDAGGGAIFRLMCTNASFTAADLLGFSTSADRIGALSYTADNVRIHTEEFIRWDLGTATQIQAFAIIGTRLDGLNIQSTATVKLQGNETDVWTAPTYEATLEWNEDAIAKVKASDATELDTLRYWRLSIVDRDNPDGYVEIASAFLGEAVEPVTGCPQFPLRESHIDYSNVASSEWGTAFGTERQKVRQWDLDWKFLTTAEKEELEEVAELYGVVYPFWVCLDPDEAFSSAYQRFIVQCYLVEMPDFSLARAQQWDTSWRVKESV